MVEITKDNNTDKEMVSHPKHYKRDGALECEEEMMLIFGKEEYKIFCKLNVFKYRYRALEKNGIEDMKKSDWYMNKYKQLCNDNE